MKAAEAHALGDTELVQQLSDAREEAFNLRLKHATGELENTAQIGASKREVARLRTIARQRGIDIQRELKS